MSEVDLPALATAVQEVRQSTPLKEIDEALKACSFGRFHIRLLCTALVGLVSGLLVTSSTSYLLPIAECDLNMDLLQKGLLVAMPFCGMLSVGVVAGFLTDTFGRKIFLQISYGGMTLCSLLAASSQTYEMLATVKFFEGAFFAMGIGVVIILTSELSYNDIRTRMLLFQSSSISIVLVLIALMSWGILSQNWNFTMFDGRLVFNTWNIYLYITSLWPLSALILYSFMPESPKYLLTQHRYEEAKAVLASIYHENTGKPKDTFSHKHLWQNRQDKITEESNAHSKHRSFVHQLVTGFRNTKPMFQRPLVFSLILVCVANFMTMLLYNFCRLWFPQLSAIVEHYSTENSTELCHMLDNYTKDQKRLRANIHVVTDICVPTKSGTETYVNSIILGLVFIIPFALSGLLVTKVGTKRLLVVASLIAFSATLALRWANSKTAIVFLFSINAAISQLLMSLTQVVVVDIFPTTTRTLAIALIMMCGRTGTLIGNVAFPVLLNISCAIPFFTLSGMMLCTTVLALLLPSKK